MTCTSCSAASSAPSSRLAGFEPAAHAAEEVEFPERVEAGIVELGVARGAGQDVPSFDVRVLV